MSFLKSVLVCIFISIVLIWTCLIIDFFTAYMEFHKSFHTQEEMFFRHFDLSLENYLKGDLS